MAKDACDVFRELQSTTWHSLGTCYQQDINLGEDAITTLLLVNIATRLTSKVVYADRRPIESTTGCDFELLVGSAAIGWYRYAIQAKRISIPSERYDYLDHKVGRAKIPQRLILRTYAAHKKAKPLYGLYNYLDSDPALFGAMFGITIAPLRIVDAAVSTYGGRQFDWIHRRPGVVPWSALVCPGTGSSTGSSLPAMAPEWQDLEQFHYEQVPSDLSGWFERGSIPATAVEGEWGPFNIPVFNPSAAVLVDIAGTEAVSPLPNL